MKKERRHFQTPLYYALSQRKIHVNKITLEKQQLLTEQSHFLSRRTLSRKEKTETANRRASKHALAFVNKSCRKHTLTFTFLSKLHQVLAASNCSSFFHFVIFHSS